MPSSTQQQRFSEHGHDPSRAGRQDDGAYFPPSNQRLQELSYALNDSLRADLESKIVHTMLGTVSDGVTVQTTDGKLLYVNDTAAALCGYSSAKEMLATPVSDMMTRFEMFDANNRPVSPLSLPGRKALRGEESDEILLQFVVKATGKRRWSQIRAIPVRADNGEIFCAINIFRDITDEKREKEMDRFLSNASTILSSSLDYETTLSSIASLSTSSIADWCFITIKEQRGAPSKLIIAHRDSTKASLASQLRDIFPHHIHVSRGVGKVMETGTSYFIPSVTPERLAATPLTEEQARIIQELNIRSCMIVPLVTHGKILGAITFISGAVGNEYDEKSLAFAEELARRAANAMDNAQQYFRAQQELDERKKAEKALRDSEWRYRFLAESLPQIVWTARPDGYNDYFNQRWFDYTGLTPADTYDPDNQGWPDFRPGTRPRKTALHPDDVERFLNIWKDAVLNGRAYEIEYRFKRASDGTFRWHLGRGIPMRDDKGTIIKWFGTCTDIHDKKEAAEAIRRSNEELEMRIAERTQELELEIQRRKKSQDIEHAMLFRLKEIMESMPVGAIAIDEEGVVLQANQEAFALFGLNIPASRMIGRQAEEVFEVLKKQTVNPQEQFNQWRDCITRKEKMLGAEIPMKDGRILTRDYIPLKSGNDFHGHLLLYRDITREKRIDATKSEFMSLASHQLRTPLTAIRWSLGKLSNALETNTFGDMERKMLHEGKNAASRMAETIDTMLTISRIEAGKLTAQIQSVSVRSVLDEIDQECQHLYLQKRQWFVIDCGREITLSTDPQFLKEILRNLAHNAIKYTPEAGHITIRCTPAENGIALSVKDDGCGIPAQEQEKLFSKFFRAGNVVGIDTNGTGLGLYLVSLLIRLLQGTIECKSLEGAGTEFIVTLPNAR